MWKKIYLQFNNISCVMFMPNSITLNRFLYVNNVETSVRIIEKDISKSRERNLLQPTIHSSAAGHFCKFEADFCFNYNHNDSA